MRPGTPRISNAAILLPDLDEIERDLMFGHKKTEIAAKYGIVRASFHTALEGARRLRAAMPPGEFEKNAAAAAEARDRMLASAATGASQGRGAHAHADAGEKNEVSGEPAKDGTPQGNGDSGHASVDGTAGRDAAPAAPDGRLQHAQTGGKPAPREAIRGGIENGPATDEAGASGHAETNGDGLPTPDDQPMGFMTSDDKWDRDIQRIKADAAKNTIECMRMKPRSAPK